MSDYEYRAWAQRALRAEAERDQLRVKLEAVEALLPPKGTDELLPTMKLRAALRGEK